MAGRTGKPGVAGDERRFEQLGQGYEHGVVGRQVVPELPRSVGQGDMGITHEGQLREVGARVRGAIAGHSFRGKQSAERVQELDVNQMRCVKVAVRREPATQIG